MPTNFCLTVRFLQPYSHGRGADGDPEWPPSPLRVFQALVAAAAARWNERMRLAYAVPALQWLECQKPPTIVAGPGIPSEVKYRLYVPDNVADKVAKSWSTGRDGSIADYRTEKDVRPTHMMAEAVHYLFTLTDDDCPHFAVLSAAARSITHLGWGVDMVVGNALLILAEEAAKLPGERWRPVEDSSATGYRVPLQGTLDALIHKHQAFLTRLGPAGFNPVPPLTAFATVGYRRDTDLSSRPFAAFALLTPDADRFRTFGTVRRTACVAGMVRHVAGQAASLQRPDDPSWVKTFVLGHGAGPNQSATPRQRFAYIPIPTVEERRQAGGTNLVVGSIRRVLVAEPMGGTKAEVAWVRQRLSGQFLIDEGTGQPTATLSLIPTTDPRLRWYIRPSDVWSTVTPVILPGYDDHSHRRRKLKDVTDVEAKKRLLQQTDARIDGLLRKAIEQAGFPPELARNAQIEWRPVGFLPGVDLALRYCPPAHLKDYPRYHVRVRWRDAGRRPVQVRGPVVIGGGRYCGLGLFAAIE